MNKNNDLVTLNKVVDNNMVSWNVVCGSHIDTFKTLMEAIKFMNFLVA